MKPKTDSDASTLHDRSPTTKRDDDVLPRVSPVLGQGEDAYRIVRVQHCFLKVWIHRGDTEPRILDAHLAERLGHATPQTILGTLLDLVLEEARCVRQWETALRNWGAELNPDGDLEFWVTERQVIEILEQSDIIADEQVLTNLFNAFALTRTLQVNKMMDADAEKSTLSPPADEEVAPEAAPAEQRSGPHPPEHPETLDNPEKIDRIYGELENRIRKEGWASSLRGVDSSTGVPTPV